MAVVSLFDLLKSRRNPIVACLASIFALASPEAISAPVTWTVNSCSDANSGSGTTGTLRYAAAHAASGDTIDLTNTGCSTISLQTGAITLPQNSITLKGPGMADLTITAKYNGTSDHDRIFNHTGTGTLAIYDLSVTKGYLKNSTNTAKGGCIYSHGSVILNGASAKYCTAKTDTGIALGGAVYTVGGLTVKYSSLAHNSAYGGSSGRPVGGGAFVTGTFRGKYSTISGNSATSAPGSVYGYGNGGGLYLRGDVTLRACTISGNTATRNTGGLFIVNNVPSSLTATLTNSTISGNSAGNVIGGVYVNSGTVNISNSTIAYNTAGALHLYGFPNYYFGPGLSLSPLYGSIAVNLQSTISSSNTVGSQEDDLSIGVTSGQYAVTFAAAPANNLIRVSDFGARYSLPSDTKFFSCPLLGSLRDNGGLTLTHALMSGSPAIDNGNNTANLNEDQRGILADTSPYPYPRVSGASADIGAYEVQQDDVIFNANFEGCLPVF